MHLIRLDTVSLDEGEAAVDLGQSPGEIVFLSFTDTDLAAVARAHAAEPGLPSLRLAKMAQLRHPMSVDLYVDAVIARAKVCVIRCLGGLDYWRYGIERVAAAARAQGVGLAVLPGDDRPDPRLDAFSTLPPETCIRLDAYFRAGGPENLKNLLRTLAAEAGAAFEAAPPQALPRGFAWCPGCGPLSLETAMQAAGPGPLALLLVYRSAILSGETAPAVGLAAALTERGIGSVTLAVSSLKDPEAVAVLRAALALRRPDIVLAATAFSARDDAGFVLDAADCPVLQAYTIGAPRTAWAASGRGMNASDLAMQVALPEFDGRLSGFPVSFKEEAEAVEGFSERRAVPDPAGIAALAERAAAWIRLRRTPRDQRRLAMVLSDYPARGGRAGYAVGLDTPDSARAIAADLAAAGFAAGELPGAGALMDALTADEPGFAVPLADYAAWFEGLPDERRAELTERWGAPEDDPVCPDGAFRFRMVRAAATGTPSPRTRGEGRDDLVVGATSGSGGEGAITVEPPSEPPPHPRLPPRFGDDGVAEALSPRAGRGDAREAERGELTLFLQPDRGRSTDRKAGYHDPDEPPTHAYLAFYLGLRKNFDALIHLGTHGTTEWLPGKAVALSGTCWPALAVGALPVVYPFIVDDPGEAAPLKRRLGGIALGHLTPTIDAAGLTPEAAALRELVEEYSAASVLDPRRAGLIATAILDEAASAGLLEGAGVDGDTPMADALTALDAHLCDLGETPFRDGLHVFGRAPADASEPVRASAEAERAALVTALDGRFVAPGPAGSPSRGRLDVMPTGRNLTTLDPRALPTRAATMLGAKAADAVVRRYLQDEGEYPARIVMDLWASPTLRTGGEDVAHALALMGVRPVWDHASTRVTGFEVLPLALLDRPRIDVTCRVSGAFRDTFPETLALLDRAARAVAAREEEDEENPLAAARRRGESAARIYGAAPGRYGAGTAETALDGAWEGRSDLGTAYLAATTHAYGDAEAPDADFAVRVAAADAYVHAFDVAERDLLDGDAAADAMGGFFAAASGEGRAPALYSLDVSNPEAPRTRTAREDIARLIRGRLGHPRWIAAQLRHGYRGAQEFAQGIEAVFVLAAATDAVSSADLDQLYGAWIADPETFDALKAANPEAVRAILERFDDLRARGLWQSRRNAAPADEMMAAE
ncbi:MULTISPECIES: cobaltochelatase subunit CobN [Methylorubrum]|uniref:cobaltochelatase subunit CobN n=1 Tax=Methylorubrum TaxID=2282523 RepID=UPI00209CCED0|nr:MULTISPECIES: cobaltochelatase subunit CobN [Methylorubrum]MCP1547398.1 cobaltochelatase CobN [Methylorubrum zatmanii]MCP1555986.1 cobaltochelatase CobN [Methylorubrum extorquens]MCP1577701.1 cobaltochelatase CobN [Methylorubrum extorquens]